MMRILLSCKYIHLFFYLPLHYFTKTLFLSRILAEASQLNIYWLFSSFCIKLCMDGRGLFKCHFDYVRHLPKSLQWCSTVFGMKSQGILIRHKSLIICPWWLTSFIAQHCHFVWMLKPFQMIYRFPNFLWYFRSHSSPLVSVCAFPADKQKTVQMLRINFLQRSPFLTSPSKSNNVSRMWK